MSVLVVLGLIWAAVLIPPVLRARAERRAEFIDSFRQQMGALGANAGRVSRLEAESEARRRRMVSPVKRRRDILGGLLGAMIGSLVLGFIPSLRMVWVLHLFLVNTFLGYVALLAHQRRVVHRRRSASLPKAGYVRRRDPARPPQAALSPALQTTRR
jgi:hypothetical protein